MVSHKRKNNYETVTLFAEINVTFWLCEDTGRVTDIFWDPVEGIDSVYFAVVIATLQLV